MPTMTAITSATIDQPGYDESGGQNVTTCFGLPGANGVKASMSSCHFTVYVAVYDYDLVYITVGGQISDPVVAASGYSSEFRISPAPFSWDGSSGRQVASGGVQYATATIDATDGSAANAPYWAPGKTAYEASVIKSSSMGWYKWDFPSAPAAPSDAYPDTSQGWSLIGHLTDFGAGPDGVNGVVYMSGTGTYPLNDGIGPEVVAVEIPGFVIAPPKDYFPFARRLTSWRSANRDGGSTTIRKTSWRDVKNSDTSALAWYRSGGAWVSAPKIGDGG